MSIAFLLALGLVSTSEEDVRYFDASLEPEGELLDVVFVDVDGDEREEVCLALRSPLGGRELHLHRIEAESISQEPFHVVPVLDEALAYGFADVRSEPGRELVFLTRGGAWSYSLTLEGYRDNARRLVETELVYDVPDPGELPFWRYVFSGVEGDWILLPERDGYTVWAPGTGGDAAEASYRRLSEFERGENATTRWQGNRRKREREEQTRTQVLIGPGGMTMTREQVALGGLLLPDLEDDARDLLDLDNAYQAPAVLDVNADERLDLVTLEDEEIHVYLADATGRIPETPTRVERLPDSLLGEEIEVSLNFADLDGDGDPDLVARRRNERDSFENEEISLFLLLNDGQRLISEKPAQVLRFEAAEMRAHVTDVDGDGRPDLAIRKFEMPSMLDAVTGLEFTLTHLVFLGESSGPRPFQRKPALKQSQTFDETTLQEGIKNRQLEMDCDGDGIADLVEIDFEGNLTIRRLRLDEGFFGGGDWLLEESPWLRFEAFGSIRSVEVRDLNGDGLGDIVSEGEDALTVLLSSTGRRRRP